MAPARRIAVMFDPDRLDLRGRQLVPGIARYAAEAGRWLWAFDPYALRRPSGACDGILGTSRTGYAHSLTDAAVPVVCVNCTLTRKPLTQVAENRYSAGRLAARHLVERGYRTFAYVGFTRQRQSRTERHAFRRELARSGRPLEACRTFANYARNAAWWDKVMASLDQWLGRLALPAGIFVCRPGLARSLADVARRRGLRIPHDIGLIAADDEPALCEPSPALTSIHADYAEIGYRAAHLLDRLIDGQPPPRQNILIGPTLVPRHSTDREALADPLVANALWFIDSRRTEPIRARHVAQAVGLALRTLEARFRRARRRTVRQEIARARVEHAKIHLERTDDTLPGIALNSGFANYQAMLRAFRQHAAMPPSAWRRQAELRRRGGDHAEADKKRPSRTKTPPRWASDGPFVNPPRPRKPRRS